MIAYKLVDFPSPLEKMLMAFFDPLNVRPHRVHISFHFHIPELFFELGYLGLFGRMLRFAMARKTTFPFI